MRINHKIKAVSLLTALLFSFCTIKAQEAEAINWISFEKAVELTIAFGRLIAHAVAPASRAYGAVSAGGRHESRRTLVRDCWRPRLFQVWPSAMACRRIIGPSLRFQHF